MARPSDPPGRPRRLTSTETDITETRGSASSISTRIGSRHFEDGYPPAETPRRLHEELLFLAAAQVCLWGLPIADVVTVRDGQRAA